LAIIAIAVMAVLVLGKTLLRHDGTIAPFVDVLRDGARRGLTRVPADLNLPPEPPRVVIMSPPESRSAPSYRCFVDGRLVYSGPEDCRPGTELTRDAPVVLDHESAPAQSAGLTEYQREMLRSADARIAREAAAARVDLGALRRGAAQASGECAALEDEIRVLDARARQPNSASTQDYLRARRQEVRSRQTALRC
jgi:hypothetical protein